MRVTVGPELDTPSWNWVGFDISRELSKYFDITVFARDIPECDLAIIVKRCPQPSDRSGKKKLMYLPIDRYDTVSDIAKDYDFLKSCCCIGCHSESLVPYFHSYCSNVFFIEHHGKFTLKQLQPYKSDGPIIWIGGMEHLPYLLKWQQDCPEIPRVHILTNLFDRSAARSFAELAQQLEVPLNIHRHTIAGNEISEWTERRQETMLMNARAAIDVKGGHWLGRYNWSQFMKPPTKTQKYISSGIPTAINSDCYSSDYFRRRGFRLATPTEVGKWLSAEYWAETAIFGAALRAEISLETVGKRLRDVILQLC